jgi:hypothetical protein
VLCPPPREKCVLRFEPLFDSGTGENGVSALHYVRLYPDSGNMSFRSRKSSITRWRKSRWHYLSVQTFFPCNVEAGGFPDIMADLTGDVSWYSATVTLELRTFLTDHFVFVNCQEQRDGIEVGSRPGLGIAIQCHISSHGISSERHVRCMVEGKQIE